MIYYSRLNPPFLRSYIYFARTSKGLCFASFAKTENEFLHRLSKKYDDELMFAPKMLRKESNQIKRYLEGKRKKFNLKLDLTGSKLQMKVWNAIYKIPYGKTVSYSKLAKQVNALSALRAVANACGKNPLPVVVPCHRVIAKDGSLGGYTGGLELKINLLKLEKTQLL